MKSRYILIAMLLMLPIAAAPAAEDWRSVLDLRGQWKFEVGNDENRARVAYNDSKWGEIFVPSAWEDEGYPGYDGYAWYRKHFRLPAGAENKLLILRLGCIDDVSKIYLNGTLIGVIGSFPPDFETAYNTEIILPVPRNILNVSGDNVIAVCVYDDQLGGGIVQGKIGLYESKDYLAPELTLSGNWKFKTGDSEKWAEPSFDDSQWGKIFVPSHWESQGYPHYDGMGWYRLHVKIPAELSEKTLVLLLGMIDDIDETYVNGVKIGHTGTIRINPRRSTVDWEFRQLRAYWVPTGLLKAGTDNVIAVRVYDARIGGGIYEGPIGLTTRERFAEWTKTQSRKERMENKTDNFFKWLFE